MHDLFERVLLPTAPAEAGLARLRTTLPLLTEAVERQRWALGPSAHARLAFEAASQAIYAHMETINDTLDALGRHLDTHPALLATQMRLRPGFRPQWYSIGEREAASMAPVTGNDPNHPPHTPATIGHIAWQWRTNRETAFGETNRECHRTFHLGGPATDTPLHGATFEIAYRTLVDLLDAFALRSDRPGGDRRAWHYRTSFRIDRSQGPGRLTGRMEIHQRCAEDAALAALLMNVPILDVAAWQAAGGHIELTAPATHSLPEQKITLATRLGASGPFFVPHTGQVSTPSAAHGHTVSVQD